MPKGQNVSWSLTMEHENGTKMINKPVMILLEGISLYCQKAHFLRTL